MPRGVYNRKKAKIKKTVSRRQRIPNGYCRINLQMPNITYERVINHLAEKGVKDANAWLMSCIYDKLPVKYSVDKQFTFPFGKYQGETASTVQDMDPEYISWACRTITGFALADDMKPIEEKVPTKVEEAHALHEDFTSRLRHGERLLYGAVYADGRRKVFARRETHWGEPRFRFLGYQSR